MGEKIFLLIAILLFCVLSVFVIGDFIAFIKGLKGGMPKKPISKIRKKLYLVLPLATYSSLMLFVVFSELTAGENLVAAIMLGIKICFFNTLRPPFSFIIIMLLCILIQDNAKKTANESHRHAGTGDG